jgi:hypothetical protein
MAKAHIETPDGVSVKLDGTPEEISAILKEVKVTGKAAPARGSGTSRKPSGKATPTTLVEDLRAEGFFKKTKTLGEVKSKLKDMGHPYPFTSLSAPMQRAVKQRRLRRFKEKGKYVYAQ